MISKSFLRGRNLFKAFVIEGKQPLLFPKYICQADHSAPASFLHDCLCVPHVAKTVPASFLHRGLCVPQVPAS